MNVKLAYNGFSLEFSITLQIAVPVLVIAAAYLGVDMTLLK